TKIGQGPEQAVAGRRVEAIGAGPKFGEEIEDALGHRPAEHPIAAELSAGVVGDEQNVGTGRVGRRQSELVLPDPEPAPAMQFVRYETNRYGSVAGGDGGLEVDDHHLAKRTEHLKTVRAAA